MAESIEQLIRRIAREEGVDGDLAVAVARQESGLNPRAVGDNGDSVGLFQLNQRGMGAGMGDARYDPETNARKAIKSLAQTQRQRPELATNPGALAAASQRPFDAAGYARSVNAMLGGAAPAAPTGSAVQPGGAAPAPGGDGYVWPVAGQSPDRARITNPFGAQQVRAAGWQGSLPPTNNGVDIGVPAGTGLVAPASGRVVEVLDAATDNSGWGNSVVIEDAAGNRHRLSHLMDAPAVGVGAAVRAGQQIGRVGATGNATGPHLDYELTAGGKPQDAVAFFRGGAGARPPASPVAPPLGGALVAGWRAVPGTQETGDSSMAYRGRPGLNDADPNAAIDSLPGNAAGAAAAAAPPVDPNETPEQRELRRQIAALEAKRQAAQAALDALRRDPKLAGTADEAAAREAVDKIDGQIGDKQLALARVPAPRAAATGSLVVNTDASDQFLLERNPDGTLKLDASGNPVTRPNPNYRPPAPSAAERPQVVNTTTTEPYITTRNPDGTYSYEPNKNYRPPAAQTVVGEDGRRYAMSEDGKSATLVGGIGQAPTKYQIVDGTNPGEKWTYDPEKGQLVSRLFEGTPKTPPVVAGPGGRYYPVNPETGLPDETRGVQLPQEPQTFTDEGTVYPKDPATGLPDTSRGVAFPRAPEQPKFSDPVAALAAETPRRQALAVQERDRLKALRDSGRLTAEQAKAQFDSWLQQNVVAPLQGLRAAAEAAQRAEQIQQDTAQRGEDEKAANFNRERQAAAFTFGEKQRTAAAGLVPDVRSDAFNQEYVANAARAARGEALNWSPQAFRPQPFDLNTLAEQESARALAAISPMAAARIGRPMPQLPANFDPTELLNGLGPYQYPG